MRWMAGLVRLAVAALIGAAAVPAAACTLAPSIATDLGSYSPASIKAAAVPALRSEAGLTCSSSTLVLLGGNYVRATFTSANALAFKRADGAAIPYIASPDPDATVRFTQGSTVDYMQNNLLNVLGLLGNGPAPMPIHLRPVGGTAPPVGVYTDVVTIAWAWNLCPGLAVLGGCVGAPDNGHGSTTIRLTLTVAARSVVLAISSAASWDPVNGTSNPRAVPGGRGRATLTANNPDLVAIDGGSLALVYPVPARTIVALDGDGATGGPVIGFADGAPASSLTLRYAGPADMADDVDFSADGGASWAFAPVAGNPASEAAVTHVRFRPKGTMARQSSFAISVPYLIR